MKIEIDILSDPKDFVEKWSKQYSINNNYLYNENIQNGLKDFDSFMNLFRWKNGIYNISKSKTKVIENFWSNREVLKELKISFRWELFEEYFKPEKSSCIWKIFLLHITDPQNFPIFDVHVYRVHYFISNGVISEIPNNQRSKYLYYKREYLDWFRELVNKHNLDPKKVDESLFSFGRKLKKLNDIPLKLIK